jgi:transketolase C-terminal domain/subunit
VVLAEEGLKEDGFSVGTVLIEKLKPCLDAVSILRPYVEAAERVIFVEEGIKNGGAAVNLREELILLGFNAETYKIVAIDDNFASPDKVCELYDYLGLSPEKLSEHFI